MLAAAAGFALLFGIGLIVSLCINAKRSAHGEPPPPQPPRKDQGSFYERTSDRHAVCVWCGRGPQYHHPKNRRCIDMEDPLS